jgi:glycosyltransferase involved in cell wall biosynthesis
MVIAVAAEHANSNQPTGVEHYSRQLILALSRIDRVNQYILYTRTPPQLWFWELPDNFTVKHLPSPIAWTQLRLSLAMLTDRPDALLVPSFSMPLLHPRNTIVAIHDLAWLLFPETETATQRWSLTFTHAFAKLFAHRLIAVSNATKKDLVLRLHVPESSVEVIHHGFTHAGEGEHIEDDHSTFAGPMIVCLGTLQPRKNLCRLIEAFARMKEQTNIPHQLVIAGSKGWMCEEIVTMANNTKDVVYLGYVKDRLSLLRKASLLVQPSLYEGFGLSILDAFAEHVPVACANSSSLPEVAGDAAEFFDPYSVPSMVSAMTNVLNSRSHAEDLARRGWDRLQHFTWEACARRTLGLIASQP